MKYKLPEEATGRQTKATRRLGEIVAQAAVGVKREGAHLIEKGEELAGYAKDQSLSAASNIERQVEAHEGFFGGLVATLQTGAKKLKKQHDKVVDKGGYVQVIGDVVGDGVTAVKRGFEYVANGLQTVEDRCFPDGEYDPVKTKEFLEDRKAATVALGKKGYEAVRDFLAEKVEDAGERYRELVPTAEEWKTKYDGIGDLYDDGPLFRPHLDRVVAFHDKAEGKLSESENRDEILQDLRAGAITTKKELQEFYRFQRDSYAAAGEMHDKDKSDNATMMLREVTKATFR